MIKTVWLLAGAICFCGCQVPIQKATAPDFYPIGIYAVRSTNDFPMVRQAGFNMVVGPANAAYLDQAKANELKVLASPGTSPGPTFNPAKARETVRRFDPHPALWAWYLVDEPDFNLIPPQQVIQANAFLKHCPATKPTALVLFQGYEALYYANITDILMIDRYPIPWLPLANFGQHVEMARLALGPRKPLMAVIQAFDWNSSAHLLRGETNLRPPTYAEMRCMTYEALARGANGLFYFAFDAGWKMKEHPATWDALTSIVREVNRRRALFTAQPRWWPKQHDFADRSIRFNAALQSSITSVRLRVEPGSPAVPRGDYILAVNNTTNTHTYWFTLPPGSEGRRQTTEDGGQKTERRKAWGVPVLEENRSIRPIKNWIKDRFDPYEVHIYGPLPRRGG